MIPRVLVRWLDAHRKPRASGDDPQIDAYKGLIDV